MEQSPTRVRRLDAGIIIALLVALIVRPLLYTLITPIYFSGLGNSSAGRSHWWLFCAWILFWEWMPFGVLWWALRRSGRPWSEIGLDWSFFVRYRIAFFIVLAGLTITAVMAPALFVSRRCPTSVPDVFISAGDGTGTGFLSDNSGVSRDLRGDMLPRIAATDVRQVEYTGLVGASGDDGGVCVYSWPIWSKPPHVLFDLWIVGWRCFYSPWQTTLGMVDHSACVV